MTTKADRYLQHKERMAAKKANRHKRRASQAIERKQGTATPREHGMELTMTWYESAEEFEKAKKLDPESYGGTTWEEMNAELEQVFERVPTAVKVPVRVDEYAAWCRENNVAVGGESRIKYVQQLFYGDLNHE